MFNTSWHSLKVASSKTYLDMFLQGGEIDLELLPVLEIRNDKIFDFHENLNKWSDC